MPSAPCKLWPVSWRDRLWGRMLSAGDNLGPYRIDSPIGKGGMGEVFHGTDTRLNRPVAIKVSAREFSDRFEREARAISALNHPNICTLYDVGPNYLVMELVEGEMLSKMIEGGPLPLDKALSYAVQIVDALAAAHAKGVIHRDLKPGNIIVTKNGVKVLDFGLAKLSSDKPGTETAVSMETVTEPITRAGAILGTLYYMPPEQVEGKEADERSDIFSFGVVFYEMITGERPFTGDTQAAVLASLLKDQPQPMSRRQPPTPRALERLVRKCLEKKPDDRWQSARDLKPALELIDLDAPPSTTSASIPIQAPPPRGGKRGLWLGIAAAVLIAVGGVAWSLWPKAAPARATRFQVTLPEGVAFDTYVSVSPDGRKLLFNATGTQSGLWIHDLDTLEWRRLAGTEDAVSPVWSPDSRFLGFAVGSNLKKVEVAGGPPQTLCTVTGAAGTGAWSKDGVIVFGHRGGGVLSRVSAAGGVATDLTAIDTARGEGFHALPTFLPDQKHFLYLRTGTADVAGIYAGSIDRKPGEQPQQRILANRLAASYVDGNLFFLRDGTLMVQPFDAGKLQLTGDAVPVAEHVAVTGSIGIFSVSPTGVLAYRTGTNSGGGFQTTWFDREGKQTSVFGQLGPEAGLALAPDGMRAAGRDAAENANGDVWLLDFTRDVRTRLTFRQSLGSRPVWSSDGSHIFFAAGNRLDTIYEKDSSGAAEEKELLKTGEAKLPTSVSRDGKFLLYNTALVPKTGPDLWVLPLEGPSQGKPVLLLRTEFDEGSGSFSPDGRWIAYVSNETGRFEVYIRPFVGGATPSFGEGKWQVSRDGASVVATPAETTLKWRNDGRELLFMGANNAIMAVDVNGSGAAPLLGAPKAIFSARQTNGWDSTADDSRFLMSLLPGGGGETPITVVLNWQADLKR